MEVLIYFVGVFFVICINLSLSYRPLHCWMWSLRHSDRVECCKETKAEVEMWEEEFISQITSPQTKPQIYFILFSVSPTYTCWPARSDLVPVLYFISPTFSASISWSCNWQDALPFCWWLLKVFIARCLSTTVNWPDHRPTCGGLLLF